MGLSMSMKNRYLKNYTYHEIGTIEEGSFSENYPIALDQEKENDIISDILLSDKREHVNDELYSFTPVSQGPPIVSNQNTRSESARSASTRSAGTQSGITNYQCWGGDCVPKIILFDGYARWTDEKGVETSDPCLGQNIIVPWNRYFYIQARAHFQKDYAHRDAYLKLTWVIDDPFGQMGQKRRSQTFPNLWNGTADIISYESVLLTNILYKNRYLNFTCYCAIFDDEYRRGLTRCSGTLHVIDHVVTEGEDDKWCIGDQSGIAD